MAGELSLIFLVVIIYISVVFLVALRLKRFDIVDIAWGGAFIITAITSFTLGHAQGTLQLLVTGLVIIWGVRLAYSIGQRVARSAAEDPRYVELRQKWKGNMVLNTYVRIFVVQGILATLVSSSVIIINISDVTTLSWLAGAGALIWAVGFLFESVGDWQLKNHLLNPATKGQLMTTGLWRYSRHPNYFGEAAQWWGIWLIALSVPFGWLGIVSPLVITILLLFISGVPLTEKRFEGRPGWQQYKQRTSVFIPLPPRKRS